MGGWGGYDLATDAAMLAFTEAFKTNEQLRSQFFFDISATIRPERGENTSWSEERYVRLSERIRQVGPDRIVFGSDWPEWSPAAYEASIRALPLLPSEIDQIFSNRTPWIL
jgi:predicted TIM-barrel fold metal-dependent hydrolase